MFCLGSSLGQFVDKLLVRSKSVCRNGSCRVWKAYTATMPSDHGLLQCALRTSPLAKATVGLDCGMSDISWQYIRDIW